MNTPKIRFNGYTEPWGQRKLGELLGYEQPTKYIVKSTEYNDNYLTPVLTAGQSFILGYTNEVDGINEADKNNPVIIFDDFTTGSHYVDFPFKVKSSAMKLLIKTENTGNIYFTYYTLKNIIYTPQGHERHWISKFSEFNVLIPSKYEQDKIGRFFKTLDDTITLHQEKLKLLKEFKKSMLVKLFPRNDDLLPYFRFKGFNDAWEQRKLGDISEFSKGRGYSKSDLEKTGKQIILYGSLYTNYKVCIKNVNTFVKLKDNSVLSQGNEIIVPSSGESSEDIARASAVLKQGIILGGDLNIIKPNEKYDSVYIALSLSFGKGKMEISKVAQGKSVVHVSNNDLKNINIFHITKEEQTKISKFFSIIDDTIAHHQEKLNLLKENKKTLLNRLFV